MRVRNAVVLALIGVAMISPGAVGHAAPNTGDDSQAQPLDDRQRPVPVVTPENGGNLEPRGWLVEEDDPLFDCRIDGNQICGVRQYYGNGVGVYIVDPGYYGK